MPASQVAELLLAVPIYVVHFTWSSYPQNLVGHCRAQQDDPAVREACLTLARAMADSESPADRMDARHVLAPLAEEEAELQMLEALNREVAEIEDSFGAVECFPGGAPAGAADDQRWTCDQPRPLLSGAQITRFVDDLIAHGQLAALANCTRQGHASCYHHYRW